MNYFIPLMQNILMRADKEKRSLYQVTFIILSEFTVEVDLSDKKWSVL